MAHYEAKTGTSSCPARPFKMATKTPDALNPLDFIREDSPHMIDEVRDLAESLVIRNPGEEEPHWADSA